MKKTVLLGLALVCASSFAMPAPFNEVISELSRNSDYLDFIDGARFNQLTIQSVAPTVNWQTECGRDAASKSATVVEIRATQTFNNTTTKKHFVTTQSPQNLRACD
ncbi:hypothetical protein K2X33_06685 [bacterium]|nr:hypothetical protein [bacterium]